MTGDLINILQEVRGRGAVGAVPKDGYYFEIALNKEYTEYLDPDKAGMYGAIVTMHDQLLGSGGTYEELLAMYKELIVNDHSDSSTIDDPARHGPEDGIYGDILAKYTGFLEKFVQFNTDYAEFLIRFDQIELADLDTIVDNIAEIATVAADLQSAYSVITAIAAQLIDPNSTLNKIDSELDTGGVLDAIYRDMVSSSSAILTAKANADVAVAKAAEAADSAITAKNWAERDVDQEVTPGEYSSKHYAIKAANSATASQVGETFATAAELNKWAAQAEALTAESHASQPEGELVRDYYSKGDGTFGYVELATYSSLHYKATNEGGGSAPTIIVKNTLDSSSTSAALSANMGKVLNETKIDEAPLNGKPHVRQEGDWDELVIPEANFAITDSKGDVKEVLSSPIAGGPSMDNAQYSSGVRTTDPITKQILFTGSNGVYIYNDSSKTISKNTVSSITTPISKTLYGGYVYQVKSAGGVFDIEISRLDYSVNGATKEVLHTLMGVNTDYMYSGIFAIAKGNVYLISTTTGRQVTSIINLQTGDYSEKAMPLTLTANSCFGIVDDAEENIYIADKNIIYKYELSTNIFTTIATLPTSGGGYTYPCPILDEEMGMLYVGVMSTTIYQSGNLELYYTKLDGSESGKWVEVDIRNGDGQIHPIHLALDRVNGTFVGFQKNYYYEIPSTVEFKEGAQYRKLNSVSIGDGALNMSTENDGAQFDQSSAFGIGTKTSKKSQTVTGEFNEAKPNTTFEVGGGTDDTNRKNLFEVDELGPQRATATLAGAVTAYYDSATNELYLRNDGLDATP